MNYENHRDPITSWAAEDRPREKMLMHGKRALSHAELLAILIGSGTRNESAVDLARKILDVIDHDLHSLGDLNTDQLIEFKGIGEAKALKIAAALELGRRRAGTVRRKLFRITGSSDVVELVAPKLADLIAEEFWIILLNKANRVIDLHCVCKGGLDATIADPRLIFKRALEKKACAIIAVHNHPSGNTNPSEADKRLTMRLQKAGELLQIPLLDHLIYTVEGYFSFADEGIL